MSQAASYRPVIDRAVFQSPIQIVAAALMSAFLVGALLSMDVQLGIALLAATIYTPIALLNLPLGVALWVPLAYLEAWPQARFVPAGVALLLGLAWLGTLGRQEGITRAVIRRHRAVASLMLLLVAWGVLSLVWATDPTTAANELYAWFWAPAIWIVVATTITTRRQIVVVCAAFVFAGLLSLAIALPQLSTAPLAADDEFRLGGSLQNPNYLAASLLTAAVLTAGLLAAVRRPALRAMLLASVAVIALGIVATGSRGGLVAALAALVAAFALMRQYRLRLGTIVVVTVAVAGLWLTTSSGATLDRVREFDTSGTGRVDLWNIALRMWSDNPVLGVGLENFPLESREYLFEPGDIDAEFIVEEPKQTHNAYLGLLAETGAVGLALYVGIIVLLLRVTWTGIARLDALGDRRYAVLGRAILIGQIAPLIALMFAHNPFNHPFWILLGLGPALITISESRDPSDIPVESERGAAATARAP